MCRRLRLHLHMFLPLLAVVPTDRLLPLGVDVVGFRAGQRRGSGIVRGRLDGVPGGLEGLGVSAWQVGAIDRETAETADLECAQAVQRGFEVVEDDGIS